MGRVLAAIPSRRQTKFLAIAFDQCFGLPARPQEILLGLGDYVTASQSQWDSVEVSRLLHESARRCQVIPVGFDSALKVSTSQFALASTISWSFVEIMGFHSHTGVLFQCMNHSLDPERMQR